MSPSLSVEDITKGNCISYLEQKRGLPPIVKTIHNTTQLCKYRVMQSDLKSSCPRPTNIKENWTGFFKTVSQGDNSSIAIEIKSSRGTFSSLAIELKLTHNVPLVCKTILGLSIYLTGSIKQSTGGSGRVGAGRGGAGQGAARRGGACRGRAGQGIGPRPSGWYGFLGLIWGRIGKLPYNSLFIVGNNFIT